MRTRSALAAAVVATLALAACGGDDDDAGGDTGTGGTSPPTTEAPAESTTETTVDEAAEIAAIEQVTTDFFRLLGEQQQEAGAELLENGADYVDEMLHCADLTAGVTVAMQSVEIGPDGTTATTTYDIVRDGEVLLAGSGGGAVKIDGEWLVAETTFLSLYDAASGSCTGPPPNP